MKAKSKIVPVILCGGSGTRLWPLSRRDFPKQFAVELDARSLLDLTLERAGRLAGAAPCVVVTGEAHRFMVEEALQKAGLDGEVLLEPEPRNTAPAVCAAALRIAGEDPDAVMVVMPSDHHVREHDSFVAAISHAADVAREGWWVTLGITPARASSAYGYIRRGERLENDEKGFRVQSFVEKPDEEAAAALIADGAVWNAGIFVVRAGAAAGMIGAHAPDIVDAVGSAVDGASTDGRFLRLERKAFSAARSISIDYAVLEKETRVAVVPFDGAWSDLGSWDAVAEVHEADAHGNRVHGDVHLADCRGSFVHSPDKLTVALGLDDVVVVETPDALLVTTRDKAENVKSLVSELAEAQRFEVVEHRKVTRPWGNYEGIGRGERYQVKRITVKPGGRLSLQYHHHRAEHWIVVRGTARVTCDGDTFMLKENESTYIPVGATHRLENAGKIPLELIEVQSGSYLGEDDIVRLEDVYGRDAEPDARAGRRAAKSMSVAAKLGKKQKG